MLTSQSKQGAAWITPACFFMIAVAYKLAWTAISSLLSQFSRDYGPRVLLQLNIAYFLPSIPILILQTIGNNRMDRMLGGLANGSLVRFTIGLGSLVLLMAFFMQLATTHTTLIATTTAVGMAYGVVFGTSYQLASRFPKKSTVMLTTGFVSSGPVVLVLDLIFKRGTYYTPAGMQQLFLAVSWITALGLGAACFLVYDNRKMMSPAAPQHVDIGRLSGRLSSSGAGTGFATGKGNTRSRGDRLAGMTTHHDTGWNTQHYHQSAGSSSHHQSAVVLDIMEGGGAPNTMSDMQEAAGLPGGNVAYSHAPDSRGLFKSNSNGNSSGRWRDHNYYNSADVSDFHSGEISSGKRKAEIPIWTVAIKISPAMLSIFLSVGTSMLVFPFFTYVRSTGLLGDRLPQVLFYVRLVGDILGRQVPERWLASTVPQLLLWAAIKTAMVPLLFACIFKPGLTGGDMGSVVVVGVFWVLSGYVNTCAYLVAPTLVPMSGKPTASGLMTVAFQSSCFLALLGAAVIQPAGDSH